MWAESLNTHHFHLWMGGYERSVGPFLTLSHRVWVDHPPKMKTAGWKVSRPPWITGSVLTTAQEQAFQKSVPSSGEACKLWRWLVQNAEENLHWRLPPFSRGSGQQNYWSQRLVSHRFIHDVGPRIQIACHVLQKNFQHGVFIWTSFKGC